MGLLPQDRDYDMGIIDSALEDVALELGFEDPSEYMNWLLENDVTKEQLLERMGT